MGAVTDIAVIGGGIMGCAVAYTLARRGHQVKVLEGRGAGQATWAAGGMLAPQLEAHDPGPLTRLGLWSRSLYPQWCQRLESETGVSTGFHAGGGLQVFADPFHLDRTLHQTSWQLPLGLRFTRLSRDEVHDHLPGVADSVVGGIFYPDEAQVDPRRLLTALRAAAQNVGAQIIAGAMARRLKREGDKIVGVVTDEHDYGAEAVVLAAGAWSGLHDLLPPNSLEPVKGQMLALDDQAADFPFRPFIWSSNGYLIPRQDGRVVVGATVEHVGFDHSVTAKGLVELLQGALAVLPRLADTPVVETWTGLRPGTADGLPLIGALAPGLWMATGHYRNGILQAPATAELLAQLMEGQRPALEVTAFDPKRFENRSDT